MKYSVILSLLLVALPTWLVDLTKDKLVIFSSLSYYKCDFDGDGLSDLSVWNPRTNTLYFQLSSNKNFYQRRFFDKEVSFQPVFADYDGDKKTDFAFFQGDTGQWVFYLTTKPDYPEKRFFGAINDLPVPADIGGISVYKPTIWRPNSSAWLITEVQGENETPRLILEGSYQDSVCSCDIDGDSKSDLTVWRPDDGVWHTVTSSTDFDFGQSDHIQYGQEWDVIVPNDYNADGKCDLTVWRPSDQTWNIFYTGTKENDQIKFGHKDDIPLSADLNGDRIPELITWNQSKKTWNVLNFKTQEALSYKWNVPADCLPAVSILQKHE